MQRKRPCRICRRWFVPHPRAGDRQRVCGRVECQRERHRRACQAWREREGDAERRHRLQQRLRADPGESGPGAGKVRWEVVRDAVGLELAVIVEEVQRLLEDAVRDAVRRQVAEMTMESGRVIGSARRDGMAWRSVPL
jgi:hypothetical protein